MIQDNQKVIESLCRQFHVLKLEVFGSAVSDEFDETRSDVDFLVEFEALEPAPLADCYFGLLAELERLFGRNVDLVTTRSLTNPYFLRAVNRTRRLLYAA